MWNIQDIKLTRGTQKYWKWKKGATKKSIINK